MNLADVSTKTVPKMTLVSKAKQGGVISTRSFIPHRCHVSIGVFAAVTVATACFIPESVAASVCGDLSGHGTDVLVEHPTGGMEVNIDLEISKDKLNIKRSGFIRTARKLFDGAVFVPN